MRGDAIGVVVVLMSYGGAGVIGVVVVSCEW